MGDYYTVTGSGSGKLWQLHFVMFALWICTQVGLGLVVRKTTFLLPALSVAYPFRSIFFLNDHDATLAFLVLYFMFAAIACMLTNPTLWWMRRHRQLVRPLERQCAFGLAVWLQ